MCIFANMKGELYDTGLGRDDVVVSPRLEVPDGPVLGFRRWAVYKQYAQGLDLKSAQLRLKSVDMGVVWEPMKPMVAENTRYLVLNKGIPSNESGVGLYAYQNAVQRFPDNYIIVGIVMLWGKVLIFDEQSEGRREHSMVPETRGYMGEFGYPMELWVSNNGHKQGLERTYPGVEVHVGSIDDSVERGVDF